MSSDPTLEAPEAPTPVPQILFPGEVFASTDDFDPGIRQLLPCYDQMLDVIARCTPPQSQRILELGCGTGELSLKILQHCPNVHIVAIDYSPRMLEFATKKLAAAGYAQQWTGVEADFGDWANNQLFIEGGFDGCVSSLAIHHLPNEMKLALFSRICKNLTPGGVFWNADPVLPESPSLANAYQIVREEWATEQGTTLAKVRAKIGKSIPHGHSKPDQLAALSTHLRMLKMAGFDPVAVPWKYYGLAVFGGFV